MPIQPHSLWVLDSLCSQAGLLQTPGQEVPRPTKGNWPTRLDAAVPGVWRPSEELGSPGLEAPSPSLVCQTTCSSKFTLGAPKSPERWEQWYRKGPPLPDTGSSVATSPVPQPQRWLLLFALTLPAGAPRHTGVQNLQELLALDTKSDVMHVCAKLIHIRLVKNPPVNAGYVTDDGSIHGLGRFPWRRPWQPIPVFLSGESHGQRSLAGYSP